MSTNEFLTYGGRMLAVVVGSGLGVALYNYIASKFHGRT